MEDAKGFFLLETPPGGAASRLASAGVTYTKSLFSVIFIWQVRTLPAGWQAVFDAVVTDRDTA